MTLTTILWIIFGCIYFVIMMAAGANMMASDNPQSKIVQIMLIPFTVVFVILYRACGALDKFFSKK